MLMEERGVQVLHIAFGLLHWKDPANAKTYNAPLMLLPVLLHRSGDAYTVQRVEGADPEPNRALLELLRRHPSLHYEEPDPSVEQGYSEIIEQFGRGHQQRIGSRLDQRMLSGSLLL